MRRLAIGKRFARRALGAAGMALAATAAAGAQSMDYGSLETLFHGPVTTSATGSPQRDTDVPVDMTIVTAQDIRRSGARDITGALRHVPGVDTLQWGNDNSDISIRGFNQAFSSGILVMVDGRQVYADYYGFIPWSALPVELGAIRQIEVVKGPNAALFGFNAAGGAINIITYNPRYDDTNTVTLRTGDPALGEISAVATVRLGTGGGLRLSGGYRRNDDFSTLVPAVVGPDVRKQNMRAAVDADFVYSPVDGVEFGLEASHTDAAVNEMSPNYSLQASRYLTNSLSGHVSADSAAGMLQLVAYSNWVGWTGAPNPWLGSFDMTDQVSVVRAEDIVTLDSGHTLRFAVGYRHNETNTAPLKGATVAQDVWSGSAMWQWQITPGLSLTAALRLDYLTSARSGMVVPGFLFTNADWHKTYDELSYNGGIVWQATDEDTLRLVVGRGVELPSLVKAGAMLIVTPYFSVTGNPALSPTVVNSYEVAWNHDMPAIDARLQISAFHEDRRNITSVGGGFVMGPLQPYALTANIGHSRAYGLELTTSGNIATDWHWSLGYRLEAVVDRFLPFAARGIDFVEFQHSTPKNLLKAGLGWSQGRWDVDGYLSWQSRTAGLVWLSNATGMNPYGMNTVLAPIAAFTSVDARIAYRLADWATLAVSGQNLLQAHQQQTVGPQVGRQIILSLTLTD